MSKPTVTVSAPQCPNCLDVIFSRARHDCHWCSCGQTMVDGGFAYLRMGYKNMPPVVISIQLIDVSENMVYQDWNHDKNIFGLIKTKVLVEPKKFKYTFSIKGGFRKYKTK